MIVVCCVCKEFIREVEPLEDKGVSHGYCDACHKVAMDRLSSRKPVCQKLSTANKKRMNSEGGEDSEN